MAQVSIPPSPAAMTRRPPLSNLPNAINSTYQMASTAKRPRPPSTTQRDVSFGQPPSKKQAVENTSLRTPARRVYNTNDSKAAPPKKVSSRLRPAATNPPAYGEIQPARKPTTATRVVAAETAEQQSETVRAWQRHYRKAFPAYIFFFENISQDVLLRVQKQISNLGAVRILKFVKV
jgi:regulatory subunit for Cdc7p protein kinase